MKKRRKGYDIGDYVDEVFSQPYEDTREEKIDAALRRRNVSHYRVKTIISGPIVESEIYPVYNRTSNAPSKPKKKKSNLAQRNLNDKNAKKKVVRLVNANFSDKDIWATFTYDEAHKPTSAAQAQKSMQRYIKRLRAYCARNNLPELKYIYVTEFSEDKTPKGKIRIHHHIIMNFNDRDKAEELWTEGGRKHTRRLQPDDFCLEGLARYLVKDPHSKKRWSSSQNLTKPTVYIADSKFSSVRQVERMLTPDGATERLNKLYPKFTILEDPHVYVNEHYGGYYIYTKMRRRLE